MDHPLAPYPSPDERERELDELAIALRGEVVVYGTSCEGRPLRALRVPGPPNAVRILCTANIHGPELVGGRVVFGFGHRMTEAFGPARILRQRCETWLVPCLNPDGYARTWARGGIGRLVDLRPNARGVDLNRNFPLPLGARRSWLWGAGSRKPGAPTYCGSAALSEPETAALEHLFQSQRFHASANMHSFMGTLIPARVTDADQYATYVELCRVFADAQPHHRYTRLASRWLDVFTGEQEDHQHHAHRTWAVCVETFPVRVSFRQYMRAPTLFWRFNPHDPTPWVENDVPGLVAYFLAAIDKAPPPSAFG